MGQGANTILSQVVAEVLKVPLDYVEVVRPDTALVPDSGPTVASRTTMVVGKLVQEAAIGLRQTLLQSGFLAVPYDGEAFSKAVKGYIAKNGHLKAYSQYNTPPQIVWDDQLYKGDAYTTFAWACYATQVSVDTRTFEVQVDDFVAVQEVDGCSIRLWRKARSRVAWPRASATGFPSRWCGTRAAWPMAR